MMQSIATNWSPKFVFYTDASGQWGCGACWRSEWIQCQWNRRWEHKNKSNPCLSTQVRPRDEATPTLARALRLNAIAHVLLLPWSPKPRPKSRPLRHHSVIKYTRPSLIFQHVTLKNTEKAWGRG